MSFAKSIDEAMDLLKASADEEITEETEETTTDDAEDTEDETTETDEDTDKGIEIDMQKAEDVDEVAELVQADGFMEALAANQTYNTERIVKAVEGNLGASQNTLNFLKSFQESIDKLTEAITGQPQPRRAVLSKSEADDAKKGMAESPVGERATDGGAQPAFSKAVVIDALDKAVRDGKADPGDIVKAETAGNDYEGLIASISPGGREALQAIVGE